MRPSAPTSAHAPRGSMVLAVTRDTVNWSRATCAADRSAASVVSASPRFHRKPILSGTSSHTVRRARFHRGDRIGHQRQFVVFDHHRLGRILAARRSFQPAPPRPARRRSAHGPPQAAADRSSVPDCRLDAGKPMPPGIGETSVRSAAVNTATTPGHGARGRGIDAADRRMRMVRANQHGLQHAGADAGRRCSCPCRSAAEHPRAGEPTCSATLPSLVLPG